MTTRTIRLAWIGLVVATVVAYLPAVAAPFLFDDTFIDGASTIHHLWPPSIPLHPLGQSTPMTGRPIPNYTLAVNYAINDLLGIDQRASPNGVHKTIGYHLFNLLLHLACGALLFGVLRRTLRRQPFSEWWQDPVRSDGMAFMVTAIWLLHPLQSEAVIYVVQRTEIIVSACYLGTLYASIRAWDATGAKERWRWYAVAIAACLVGMASKEVMISAPLAVLLYDLAFRWTVVEPGARPAVPAALPKEMPAGRARHQRRAVPEKGHARPVATKPASSRSPWAPLATESRPAFYLGLWATTGLLILLMSGGPRSDTVGFHLGVPWYRYLYSQAWAILHYVRLFFWPNRLTLDYGVEPIRGPGGFPGLLLLGVFLVMTIVAWTRVRRWGWFGFLGAWFFLLLGPSSSIVPIVTEIAAERRIYLALVSVIVLVLLAIVAAARRLSRERATTVLPRIAGACGLALCLALGAATFERSGVYRDPIGMWRDVVNKYPLNMRGYADLAGQLMAQTPPRNAEADRVLRQSLQVDSAYTPSLVDLGVLATKRGQTSVAQDFYERALRINPRDAGALARLGVLLQAGGAAARAIPYYERLLELKPSEAQYMVDLGVAYMDVGRLDDAIREFRQALQIEPTRQVALNRLGGAYLEKGQAGLAVPFLEAAVQQQPGSGFSLALLSRAYAESGHIDEATQALNFATARADTTAEGLSALGDANAAVGRHDAAVELYRRALRVKPDYQAPRAGLDRLAGRGR